MARTKSPFKTERGADPAYLHVHVDALASVILKRDDEGVVVDVYPYKDYRNPPEASTWAHEHDLNPEGFPSTAALTPWQHRALSTYAGGDFAHLADSDCLHQELRHCGDGLLRFIFAELSEREDCGSIEDAIRRMQTARNDISTVIHELQQAQDAPNITPDTLNFTVSWTIDSDAATPEAAALEARAAQCRRHTTATVFTVRDNRTGVHTTVDLADLPAQAPAPA